MLNVILLTILLFIALGLVAFIVYGLKDNVSGLKIMLLGINITLFGGIIAVDPNSYLAGFEYLIVLSGLVLSVMGFVKKD